MINEKNLKYPYFRKRILLKKKTMIVHIEICIFAQVFFPSIQFWYNLRSSNIYLLIKEKIPFMIWSDSLPSRYSNMPNNAILGDFLHFARAGVLLWCLWSGVIMRSCTPLLYNSCLSQKTLTVAKGLMHNFKNLILNIFFYIFYFCSIPVCANKGTRVLVCDF